MSPGSSIRCPRMFESATFTSPAGSTPTARAAASAASALPRMWADVNGSVRPGGSSLTSPPGPNVTVVTSARRWGSSSGSPAGTIAVPPGSSAAISSAFVAAIASMLPSSSRCTGPMLTITTTSGSAIAASSAIWPAPRIAISRTSTSVPGGAPRTVRGSPISVFRFCGVATTRRCGASIPASRSFVDVLPVEPVMPITRARSARRHAVARRPSAASGSSEPGTTPDDDDPAPSACDAPPRTPQAPPPSACGAKRPPSTLSPASPTKRSPSPTARESMTTRAGPPARGAGAASRAPAACATRSGDQSRTQRLAGDGDVVERDLAPPLELLPLLVALAGDDHDVARLGDRDRSLDRGAAVDLDVDAAPAALQDLGDDRLRVLVARVVRRDDHDVGLVAGDRAHERPLRAVAVPAGAEHDDEAPARERARGAQHVVERVGRVGVVDEHRERLALVDRLEAARHAHGPGEAVGDRRIVEPQRARRGHRAEHVQHVEAPRQRRVQLEPLDRKARAARVALDPPRAHLGVKRVDADPDRVGEVERQAHPVRIVDVDHRDLRAGLEQPPLGEEVVLHGRVEV